MHTHNASQQEQPPTSINQNINDKADECYVYLRKLMSTNEFVLKIGITNDIERINNEYASDKYLLPTEYVYTSHRTFKRNIAEIIERQAIDYLDKGVSLGHCARIDADKNGHLNREWFIFPNEELFNQYKQKIIEYAEIVSMDTNNCIDTHHLLLSIAFHKNCSASKILSKLDFLFYYTLKKVNFMVF